jgi:hypothetical protein
LVRLTNWSRWFANEDTLDDNPSPESQEPIWKNVIIKKNQNASRYYISITFSSQKSNQDRWLEPSHGETKREGQRKAKRCTTCKNPKKREKARPSHTIGNYVTHSLFNVACMLMMRFNNNRRTSVTRQCDLPLYSKG